MVAATKMLLSVLIFGVPAAGATPNSQGMHVPKAIKLIVFSGIFLGKTHAIFLSCFFFFASHTHN